MCASFRLAFIAVAWIGFNSALAATSHAQAIYEPYTVSSFAGAGDYGSNDGPPDVARFYGPDGMAVDGNGNVYVADRSNCTLRKIAPDGTVSTLAGTAGQCGTADGQGAAARFFSPRGVALDSAANIYVVDSSGGLLRKVTPSGLVTTHPSVTGAGLSSPTGVAVDGTGNIFLADTYNHTIRKVTPDGTLTTFAGTKGASGNVDGVGPAARFYFPSYLAVDAGGTLYVSDGNYSVRKIAPNAAVTTLAGGGVPGTADGTGSAARFRSPAGIAVDGAGNVFVADSSNHTLRKITPAGVTRTLAGLPGDSGSVNGTASQARLGDLSGLAIDSSGALYFAENYFRQVVRRAIPGGPYPTPAPSPVSTATPFPALTPAPTPTPAPSPNHNPHLDASFRGPRLVSPGTPGGVRLLASGKFLVFDDVQTLQNREAGGMVRYNADGSYDPSFRFSALDRVYAVAELPNEQLLVAGLPHWSSPARTNGPAYQVRRVNADGSLDESFAANAIADTRISWLVVQPDNKIVVAGSFTQFAGAPLRRIVRLLPSGALDTSFSPPTLSGSLGTAPVIQPDGRILIAGSFTQVNNTPRLRVARLNGDGSLDSSFAPSGFTTSYGVRGLVLLPDGQVVIAGRFTVPPTFPANPTGTSYNGVPLLRLNANGVADGTFGYFDAALFGNDDFYGAEDLAVDANGKYLLIAARPIGLNLTTHTVFRFETNGAIDSSFHRAELRSFEPGLNDFYGAWGLSIEAEPGGSMLIAGIFNSVDNDGIPRVGVVRLNGNGTPAAFAPEVAGSYDYPQYVVRFSDGRSWATASPFFGASGGIYSALPHNLARLNTNGTFDFSFDITPAADDPRFVAYGALALAGDNAFVWGVRGDGATRNYFRVSANGSVDPAFRFDWAAPPFSDAAVLSDGRVLLVAGDDAQANAYAPIVPLASDGSLDRSFQVAPVVRNKIFQRFDGQLSAVNAGTFLVASMPNGQMVLQYLGPDGLFRLSRLNSDGSFDASFSDSAFPPTSVRELSYDVYDPVVGRREYAEIKSASDPQMRGEPLPDGSIVVVGHFTSFAGVSSRGVMRLLPNGAIDEAFSAKVGAGAQWTTIAETAARFPAVEDIVKLPGDDLLIVGDFEAFNGVNAPGIARLKPDGSIDTSFAPPVRRVMNRSADAKLFPQADGSVMLSGPYSFAGEEALRSLVRLRFDQPTLVVAGAASRKTHGGAGSFDVVLPLTGDPGVESRNGGANGEHTIVVTFGTNISTGQASVTSGNATIAGQPTISGNTMTIPLASVSNAQIIGVAISNVTSTSGQSIPDAALNVGFLIGDSNGDRVVNSADALQTRTRSGQETNGGNHRSDFNADGSINSADATIVRGRSGQSIP